VTLSADNSHQNPESPPAPGPRRQKPGRRVPAAAVLKYTGVFFQSKHISAQGVNQPLSNGHVIARACARKRVVHNVRPDGAAQTSHILQRCHDSLTFPPRIAFNDPFKADLWYGLQCREPSCNVYVIVLARLDEGVMNIFRRNGFLGADKSAPQPPRPRSPQALRFGQVATLACANKGNVAHHK